MIWDWFLIIIALLSTISSLIAWVVKLKWSKEFKEAKEAQISTLKERIEFYKEISSPQLISQLLENKSVYENQIEEIRENLESEKEKNREGSFSKDEYMEKIESLLSEKEVLLYEIHHRVKNNLAIITGLMELQAHEVGNKAFRENITRLQRRIFAISTVHEIIYSGSNFSEIEVSRIIHSFENQYNILIDYKENNHVELILSQVVPLSLLVNEIFSGYEEAGVKNLNIETICKDNLVELVFHPAKRKENDHIELFKSKETLSAKMAETLILQLSAEFNSNNRTSITFTKITY